MGIHGKHDCLEFEPLIVNAHALACSTPLILSFCDYLFLGRALPNMRSWLCLLMLLAGAVGYVMTDTAFRVDAYLWLAAW
jgi:hypothetical protein